MKYSRDSKKCFLSYQKMCDPLFTLALLAAATRKSRFTSPADENQTFQFVEINVQVPDSTSSPVTLGTSISVATTPLRKFYVFQQNSSGGSANVLVSVNGGTPQIIASNVPSNSIQNGTINPPIIVNRNDVITVSCISTGSAFTATTFTVAISSQ
jgi:hypothetical protein